VGSTVGLFVGAPVGSLVGITVGVFVGSAVGAAGLSHVSLNKSGHPLSPTVMSSYVYVVVER